RRRERAMPGLLVCAAWARGGAPGYSTPPRRVHQRGRLVGNALRGAPEGAASGDVSWAPIGPAHRNATEGVPYKTAAAYINRAVRPSRGDEPDAQHPGLLARRGVRAPPRRRRPARRDARPLPPPAAPRPAGGLPVRPLPGPAAARGARPRAGRARRLGAA